jgi:hypothetical protein
MHPYNEMTFLHIFESALRVQKQVGMKNETNVSKGIRRLKAKEEKK